MSGVKQWVFIITCVLVIIPFKFEIVFKFIALFYHFSLSGYIQSHVLLLLNTLGNAVKNGCIVKVAI
jgi:hypothetical protein